jgi:hypothetical protein
MRTWRNHWHVWRAPELLNQGDEESRIKHSTRSSLFASTAGAQWL